MPLLPKPPPGHKRLPCPCPPARLGLMLVLVPQVAIPAEHDVQRPAW